MTGVKGKTGTHTNRSNQWVAGTATRIRTDEVFSFKPKIEVIEAIKTDIEQTGITKTEWLDAAVEAKLGRTESSENQGLPDPVRDAIATAIGLKTVAISRERKNKIPDEKAIAQWEAEIEELENYL